MENPATPYLRIIIPYIYNNNIITDGPGSTVVLHIR